MRFRVRAVFFIGIFINQIVVLVSGPSVSKISNIAVYVNSSMTMTKTISCSIQTTKIYVDFTASIFFRNDISVLSKMVPR